MAFEALSVLKWAATVIAVLGMYAAMTIGFINWLGAMRRAWRAAFVSYRCDVCRAPIEPAHVVDGEVTWKRVAGAPAAESSTGVRA